MKMNIFFFLFLMHFLSQAETLEGIAKNKKAEIIYIEKHNIELDEKNLNKSIRVEYSKPDGTLFATLTSDFSKNKTVPDTVFEDLRFKTKSTLQLKDEFVEFEEFKNEKLISKKSFPFSKSMVASQGFDNFIKMNLEKLENIKIKFKFGVLENKDFYSLTGYKKTKVGDDAEYGIKSSSWLINMFAGEIKVVYKSKTKKIKSFSGRSNILDDFGKSQDVVINYEWESGT